MHLKPHKVKENFGLLAFFKKNLAFGDQNTGKCRMIYRLFCLRSFNLSSAFRLLAKKLI